MDTQKFMEIIDFAIEREREAVKFYHQLLEHTRFFDMKEVLREFEMMERGHISILENMKMKKVVDLDTPKVETLQIADYLVAPVTLKNLDYQDILIVGMKREELSMKLYTDLARDFTEPEIKQVFEKLASEEARHKLRFEKLYDREVLKEN